MHRTVIEVILDLARLAKGARQSSLELHGADPERIALAAKLAVHVPAAWHPYGEALQALQVPGAPLAGWLSAELVLPGDHVVTWTVHRLEQPPGWTEEVSSGESARLAAGYVLADLYRQALVACAGGEPGFVDYARKAS